MKGDLVDIIVESLIENREIVERTDHLFSICSSSMNNFFTEIRSAYFFKRSAIKYFCWHKLLTCLASGQSYVLHQQKGKTILLFLRECKNDMDGNTQGFVFIGPINYVDSYGSKPMSITWHLEEPIPNYLWKESAKMRVG